MLFHVQISIAFLKEVLDEGLITPDRVLMKGDGSYLSSQEVVRFIKLMEHDGLRLVPVCDNCDDEGRCCGHIKAMSST